MYAKRIVLRQFWEADPARAALSFHLSSDWNARVPGAGVRSRVEAVLTVLHRRVMAGVRLGEEDVVALQRVDRLSQLLARVVVGSLSRAHETELRALLRS